MLFELFVSEVQLAIKLLSTRDFQIKIAAVP